MQIFLPYKSFKKSAEVLDYQRLGKQSVEALQIINIIEGKPRKDGLPYKGWLNHPCITMWQKYVPALKLYYNVFINEWISRGYKNNMPLYELNDIKIFYPNWLGNKKFHLSHRSNLMRKNYTFYKKFKWNVDPLVGYAWLDGNGNWYEQNIATGEKIFLSK